MVKQADPANRMRIWAFGQSYDFYIVTTDHQLTQNEDVGGTIAAPQRRQKTQIVLHCTSGSGSAEAVIDWWNISNRPDGAHFIVERTWVGQAARPAPPANAADNPDTGLVDAVRVIDEDVVVHHGGMTNPTSIGIEIVNVGWGWYATNMAREPSLAGRHVPLNTCPAPTNIASVAAPVWRCNHARPQDRNRFISLGGALGGYTDYQAFEEEQYTTLILLLRSLCIRHRIPRQFLGTSTEEVFRHWLYRPSGNSQVNRAQRRVNRSTVFHFRGILHHRNAHRNKPCPGILHRNRLYRGIIDEWWLPVQFDGSLRPYYSGPFAPSAFAAGRPTRNAFFRAGANGQLQGTVFENADCDPTGNCDALMEAKSYYDTDRLRAYYAKTETRQGGIFPVGVNKVWHGGVHLPAVDANPCVYTAASGTIVAARLSSHAETERHAKFGSQRFVLIRHAVYLATQPDPEGVGTRINYDVDPVFVFSLYMHLAAVADLAAEHDENPPWFNLWRRQNPGVDIGMVNDGERGKVFAPNIKVAVGDILGHAGTFRGRRMIHFEVLTHRNAELTMAPWDDVRYRAFDTNDNVICDVSTLDRFLTDVHGDGLDAIDVLRAAPQLRHVKAFHKSEWALTSENQIASLITHRDRRRVLWPHFQRFSWVAEAVSANPDLTDQLGDANGMFWHYHPITFMQHVNRLSVGENRELREAAYQDTNVQLDDDNFLTNFIDWDATRSQFEPADADNERLRAAYVSSDDRTHHPDRYVYHFTREDIACQQPGAHRPGPTPPQSTKFSATILQLLERIRQRFGASLEIELSYVCAEHADGGLALCIMNNAGAMTKHHDGVAVDFRPSNLSDANCRQLWNCVVEIADPVDNICQELCGTPTQADLPAGYEGVRYQTRPATVQAKLTASPQQALTAAEVAAFCIHLELTEAQTRVRRADTTSLPVNLRVTLLSLEVLDDRDWGKGEWTIISSVNGRPCGGFSTREVDTGDTITLGGNAWTREVTIDPTVGEALVISMSGSEEDDVSGNDSLGSVRLWYDQETNPPWGIGTHAAVSSNRSFRLTYKVESLNVEF